MYPNRRNRNKGTGGGYVYVFVVSFLMYLLLVWSGGRIAMFEVVVALVLAAVIAVLFRRWNPERKLSISGLNPRKWFDFLHYLFGPFALGLAKANIDVAKRVITGNIRPGIVRVNPGLKTDLGKTILADSITLTPGTLTVDIDDDGWFYIHWLFVRDEDPAEEELYGNFAYWARRLAE